MTAGTIVFLLGLYVVPLVLLAWGHRVRRLSTRNRRAFWGAIIGHCVAVVAALFAGMLPPESWTDDSVLRGILGFWGLFVLPLGGSVVAMLTTSSRQP